MFSLSHITLKEGDIGETEKRVKHNERKGGLSIV